MKWTIIFSYIVVSSFALAEEEPKKERKATETGEIIEVDSEDKEMEAAIKKAQDTFVSQFIKMTADEKIKQQITLALLKVEFTPPKDEEANNEEDAEEFESEHMWVKNATFDGKMITGILASQPHNKRLPALNSIVSFKIDRISDWMIVKDGFIEGGFSVQLLRSRMNEKERQEHDSHYPFSFEKKKDTEKKQGEESP